MGRAHYITSHTGAVRDSRLDCRLIGLFIVIGAAVVGFVIPGIFGGGGTTPPASDGPFPGGAIGGGGPM